MAREPLPIPTAELVQGYLDRWDSGREGQIEAVIVREFTDHPRNVEFRDVLLKAALVDRLYGTQVWEIARMADHILSEQIDEGLNMDAVDCEMVKRIARYTTSRGNVRVNTSFASKYCSFHRPTLYPIHDSVARWVLNRYLGDVPFDTFLPGEKWDDYAVWERSFQRFCRHFGLDRTFTIRQVDKFVWMLGKEHGF